jgi:hypothetical protein
VAVLFVSWFLWVVIAEIPDDKKIIKMMLEPLKLLLTLLACSTLLAVVLVGLYLLYSLVVHLSSRLVELVKDSMRILGL